MIGRVLFNHIDQVLAPLRLLQFRPPRCRRESFEAFGDLVPTTLVLDDLYVAGVLEDADGALDGASALELCGEAAAARTGRSPPAAARAHSSPADRTRQRFRSRHAGQQQGRGQRSPRLLAFFLHAGQSTATITSRRAAELGIRHELTVQAVDRLTSCAWLALSLDDPGDVAP